ncbi:MAG TPA: metallophosphoesterase, partial [Planctomycetota bacterium]|nr:metallophosphoesterase [Planctomycetota bacterium]
HRIVSAKVKRPLKIAIIADIQTDEIGDYERRALELAKAENPDLVLFAGDYLQEHDDARRKVLIRDLRVLLKECGFKFGVAVEGNCDYDDWPEIFEGTGVELTRETREYRHGDVQITALSLMDSEYANQAKIGPSERFHIVLGHIPNFAEGNVQADLLVAGHTHGGQVRLPGIGPLITLSRIPRSWAAGLTELGDRTLIVSRGIGMERGPAPRLRFLCRPELVIVDVVPGGRNSE